MMGWELCCTNPSTPKNEPNILAWVVGGNQKSGKSQQLELGSGKTHYLHGFYTY